MSTLVRKSGNTGTYNRFQSRATATLSNGDAVMVVQDFNSASSFDGTYGDRTGVEKLYVYTSANRTTWTLRTTITAPLGGGRFTINVSATGLLGIVYWTNTNVRYLEISTTTWVHITTDTVRAALVSPNEERDFDISYTATGVPCISALRQNTTGTTRLQLVLYVRNTAATPAWIATIVVAALEASTTPKTAYQAVSVAALIGGTTGARNIVIAAGHGTGTTDRGIKVYTCQVAEATGVVTNIVLRKTYAVGEVPGDTTATRARNVMLFQSAANQYTLGFQHLQGVKTFGVARGTYDGTTYTETIPPVTSTITTTPQQYNMALTYAADRVAFHWVDGTGNIFTRVARLLSTGTFTIGATRWFNNKTAVPVQGLVSNGGPYTSDPQDHDVSFIQKIATNRQEIEHHYVKPAKAPVLSQPANAATVNTSVPQLKTLVDLDIQYPQAQVRVRWEFAKDSAFTTNYFVYEQPDTAWKTVANTQLAGATVLVTDQLPNTSALSQGIWYVRASVVDEYGVVGTASAANAITVAHAPVAANLAPNSGYRTYGTGTLTTSWTFTDPNPVDTQSAFQVIVTRTDTGATVLDSGKVVSSAQTYDAPINNVALKDVELNWTVRLWDSDDVPGPYATDVAVVMVDAPSVAITTPANGATLTTAIPTIGATVTVGGTRTIKKWRVQVLSGGVDIPAAGSGWKASNLVSGDPISYSVPDVADLQNATSYTIQVTVEDSFGIRSTAATVAVTTGWTPPLTAAGVTVNTTSFNTEGAGYILLSWNDANRDTSGDFRRWVIWRLETLLDPLTSAVLLAGTWEQIGEVTVPNAGGYTYRDYTAPSGYQVSYRVEQEVERFGDRVSSTNGTVNTVSPVSDSYWLIDMDNTPTSFRLGTITADSYTDEYEEEDYVVIGRGRHYEQGERLGLDGSLTAQIRNSNGISARQHKQRLEQVKKQNRRMYLRTPFGDMFRVAVSSMQISRVAGVGLSEFIDVTIPYKEVGD